MSRSIKVLICLVCLLAPGMGQTTIPLSGFECQAPASLVPTGTPDCEGWLSVSGIQLIMPDGLFLTGPCTISPTSQGQTSFPLDGTPQWCEVGTGILGPADPVGSAQSVPPSTPGVWPFVPGSVSEMQLQTIVPVSSTGVTLSIDSYWFSGEMPSDPIHNDFAQILLIDPATNSVILTVMYVDTFPPNVPVPNLCPSGLSSVPFAASYGGGQTSTVTIPASLQGQSIIISAITGNQGDQAFASVLYLDNVRWGIPPPRVGSLTLVSEAAKPGNDESEQPAISGNGNLVAFESKASNLVMGDTNGDKDIFVRDMAAGTIERVSVSTAGVQGNGDCKDPSISASGRWVAFSSHASNLVAGDTNSKEDIFLHDRQTGQTTRVSMTSTGSQANHHSWEAVLSGNGAFVAFVSKADNLVTGDTNRTDDIFVAHVSTGAIERVSVSSTGGQGFRRFREPAISHFGTYIAFQSRSSLLVPGDTNWKDDIFVRNRLLNTTLRASVDSFGGQGDGESEEPAIGGFGRFIAFASTSSNLVPGDTNKQRDIFVHDIFFGTTVRVSVPSVAGQANGESEEAWMSGMGRHVAFESEADNLVLGDNNNEDDIFVHDLLTGLTTLISITDQGLQGNGDSCDPMISFDGLHVAFVSESTNFSALTGGARSSVSGQEHVFVGIN